MDPERKEDSSEWDVNFVPEHETRMLAFVQRVQEEKLEDRYPSIEITTREADDDLALWVGASDYAKEQGDEPKSKDMLDIADELDRRTAFQSGCVLNIKGADTRLMKQLLDMTHQLAIEEGGVAINGFSWGIDENILTEKILQEDLEDLWAAFLSEKKLKEIWDNPDGTEINYAVFYTFASSGNL